MVNEWLVMKGSVKLMESGETEILNYVRTVDPFVHELTDGMTVGDLIISKSPRLEMKRSDDEAAIWSFTRTLHKQIHDASDAAYRGQYKKSKKLLKLVQTRLNHFLSKQ